MENGNTTIGANFYWSGLTPAQVTEMQNYANNGYPSCKYDLLDSSDVQITDFKKMSKSSGSEDFIPVG